MKERLPNLSLLRPRVEEGSYEKYSCNSIESFIIARPSDHFLHRLLTQVQRYVLAFSSRREGGRQNVSVHPVQPGVRRQQTPALRLAYCWLLPGDFGVVVTERVWKRAIGFNTPVVYLSASSRFVMCHTCLTISSYPPQP